MRSPLVLIIAVVAAIVLFSAVYTLDETEQAIITQFGRPIGGVIDTPGLHAKIPLIQQVHVFDKRWLEFDGAANEIPTRDKKYIWVDTYARWRIADALRFYQAVRDERGGQSRLDDIVDGETRNAIASFDLIEIVRSSDREFQLTGELEGIMTAEAVAAIETGREAIAQQILERASTITPEFGVELVDVRFKRINYTEYRKAPDVTRKRMYLETMTELLPQLGQKVILDESARGVLPLLQLDGRVKEVTP